MGFLGFRKRKDFVDLGEHYRKQQERANNMREDIAEVNSQRNSSPTNEGSSNAFGFFSSMASAGSSASEDSVPTNYGSSESVNPEERRRRILNKKLSTITDKLEDLSNQIYHLQQRVEVLERKNGVGRY